MGRSQPASQSVFETPRAEEMDILGRLLHPQTLGDDNILFAGKATQQPLRPPTMATDGQRSFRIEEMDILGKPLHPQTLELAMFFFRRRRNSKRFV